MPTLEAVRSATKPVAIEIGEADGQPVKITLHVLTMRGTIEDHRAYQKLLEESDAESEALIQQARALDQERAELLKPATEITRRIRELKDRADRAKGTARAKIQAELQALEQEHSAALEPFKDQLAGFDQREEALNDQASQIRKGSLARKLAFYVARHDVTTPDGQPIESSVEFYRDTFDDGLLASMCVEVDRLLLGNFRTGNSSGE